MKLKTIINSLLNGSPLLNKVTGASKMGQRKKTLRMGHSKKKKVK